jgi:hypothetical protein
MIKEGKEIAQAHGVRTLQLDSGLFIIDTTLTNIRHILLEIDRQENGS